MTHDLIVFLIIAGFVLFLTWPILLALYALYTYINVKF